MPRYLVLEKSFINNAIVEAGTEIEIPLDESGKPIEISDNLKLIEPKRSVEEVLPALA
jgi:hypothetical protein